VWGATMSCYFSVILFSLTVSYFSQFSQFSLVKAFVAGVVHVLQNLTYTHRVAFRQLVATFYTNFPGQFRKLRETKYLRKVSHDFYLQGYVLFCFFFSSCVPCLVDVFSLKMFPVNFNKTNGNFS
jgi:hypothetical protein